MQCAAGFNESQSYRASSLKDQEICLPCQKGSVSTLTGVTASSVYKPLTCVPCQWPWSSYTDGSSDCQSFNLKLVTSWWWVLAYSAVCITVLTASVSFVSPSRNRAGVFLYLLVLLTNTIVKVLYLLQVEFANLLIWFMSATLLICANCLYLAYFGNALFTQVLS